MTPLGLKIEQRGTPRVAIVLTGRLIWRDSDGSQTGAFVECISGCGPIPLYRLVDLRLDESARSQATLPSSLKQPRVPAAVYRVGSTQETTGLPDSYALRLLARPARRGSRRHPSYNRHQPNVCQGGYR